LYSVQGDYILFSFLVFCGSVVGLGGKLLWSLHCDQSTNLLYALSLALMSTLCLWPSHEREAADTLLYEMISTNPADQSGFAKISPFQKGNPINGCVFAGWKDILWNTMN
jgi:hypothetical protein